MRYRRAILAVAVTFLLALFVGAALEPNKIVPGLLHGEPFYDHRPTRYWREVLQSEGQTGHVGPQTISRFGSFRSIPVLRRCLKDPDRNVRWPAAALLARLTFPSDAVPDLIEAMDDPDLEVRAQAIMAIRSHGPNAFAAGPRLAEIIHDENLAFADLANSALWKVDPRRAVVACGWKPFVSKEWCFRATMPEGVQHSQSTTPTPLGDDVIVENWTAMHGATALTIGISVYSENLVREIPPEEWFRRLKDNPGPFGLHIVRDQTIELNGLRGWEFVAESELGHIWKRLFWVGRRLYQVQVAYNPKFANIGAGHYFLESFQIDADAAPK
jgi:hypothetical protein